MNFENICTEKEAEFLLSHLKPTDRVLEWGNGDIALQIASKVKHVTVITHDLKSMEKLIDNQPQNMSSVLVPPTEPQQSDDGAAREYHDYIQEALPQTNRFGKFSVIIIRGRARVACARMCEQIAKDTTKVFIQDYNHPNDAYTRKEYFEAEQYLQHVDGEFTMHMFKVKALQNKKVVNATDVVKPKPTKEQAATGKKIAKQAKK